MLRSLALASALLVPVTASADARRDITDIRHGRTQSHQELLGWTADGRAVARRLVCSEGGELICTATIDTLEVGAPQATTELWTNADSLYEEVTPDDPKGPISTAEATAFIRKEARVIDELPALVTGTPVATPTEAFGTIGGEPTTVTMRTSPHPTEPDMLAVHVTVQGPRGTSIDLETMVDETMDLHWSKVLAASISPDGGAVWLAVHYGTGFGCWDFEDIELTVADRGLVRAKLANAAGLRALRDGEVDEALALFTEATESAPRYAWGWFNRGAVHSRRGELSSATESLQRAIELDPRLADRACHDEDYGPLVASDDGDRLLACDVVDGC